MGGNRGWRGEQKEQGSHLDPGYYIHSASQHVIQRTFIHIWSCLGQSILGNTLAATCSSFSASSRLIHQWQHQHLAATTTKQREDLHFLRWKRSLGRGWQGKRWQSNGNHWSWDLSSAGKVCALLPGAEMLAAMLRVSQWANKTVYSVWYYKWVSDGFVLPEEMNWRTEKLLLAADRKSVV